MPRAVLLFPYSTQPEYSSRQKETRDFLAIHSGDLEKLGIRIDFLPVGEDTKYEEAIKERWNGDSDLILIEHDVVPRMRHFRHLMQCAQEWCGVTYPLYWCRLELHPPDYYTCLEHRITQSFRQEDTSQPLGWRWGTPGEELADHMGFGLTRFRRELMARVPPTWEPGKWVDIDSRQSRLFVKLGVKGHVHYPPMRHNHPFASNHGHELYLWNHDHTVLYDTLPFRPMPALPSK